MKKKRKKKKNSDAKQRNVLIDSRILSPIYLLGILFWKKSMYIINNQGILSFLSN